MTADRRSAEQFLVEWYEPELTAAPLSQTAANLQAGTASASAAGSEVRLDYLLAAPIDDVLYGVFTAGCATSVRRACRQAGWPPNRVTAGIRTHLTAFPRECTRPSRGGDSELPVPSG